MTIDIFCFYLQNRLIQTSQTGGQWYSDTSPFSIPWIPYHSLKTSQFQQSGVQMSLEGGLVSGDVGTATGYDSDGRASTPSLDLSEDGEPRQPLNPSQQGPML